ncbi:MurR/RpiR family transcriptional regulator [Devosia sp.]|uniref:MurR/RpiR family transcriptional regulator n=1 Tax=Devosia sp. TaxID=1871048 RepID=UPI001AC78865|nr:MurR/RpiR family transcriptional regulator [Devosia sp.]MBN9311062.1 MurR/RpiR family transcriptional regulator [Devosia sp.]
MADADIKLDEAAPRDFPALRALIAARVPTLPRRLTQVATYALDHPDEIAFGTAASVAQDSGVQPSTLVRFSQALGYQGFTDLQDVFRARLRDRVPSYEERLKQLREHGGASTSGLLLQGFADAAERSVADLRVKLDPAVLDRAVDILAGADTIYLVGLRRSFPITSYMAYAMGKLNVRSVLVDGVAGLGAEQINFISPRDAVLAISFTPYASETVSLAHAARARQAKLVSITDSIFSPIASIADAWLEIVEADFEGFRSMAATMALAMTLTVAVAGRRGEK